MSSVPYGLGLTLKPRVCAPTCCTAGVRDRKSIQPGCYLCQCSIMVHAWPAQLNVVQLPKLVSAVGAAAPVVQKFPSREVGMDLD